MPDPRHIVDDIRGQLAAIADGGTPVGGEAAVADLALAYAEMCQETNRRLRRCGEYLARGLRSEAVHQAMCPPDLWQTVDALAFADRVDWARLCFSRRLPVPAPLSLEGLPALREAIAIERKLEPLLARHRVLAIAREPVAQRLAVLRLLAESDANAPSWDEQIRELETLRLRQMREEAKAAFRSRSQADIEQLYEEITRTPWRSDVPADLQKVLSQAADILRLEGSVDELRLLAEQLARAMQAGDYVAGHAALSRWQELVNTRRLAVPDELLEKVRAAAAWISAEDRRCETRQKLKTIQPILEAEENAGRRRKMYQLMRNAALILAFAALLGGGWFGIMHFLRR